MGGPLRGGGEEITSTHFGGEMKQTPKQVCRCTIDGVPLGGPVVNNYEFFCVPRTDYFVGSSLVHGVCITEGWVPDYLGIHK